ncbi:MAG: hypothetical protein NUW37_05425, partial [Planctomycetes bacterium]|nr:hypothetical protein [Planctomycetota bacterium]
AYKLDVAGDINFTGSLLQNGSPFSAGGSLWTDNGANIGYSGDYVQILGTNAGGLLRLGGGDGSNGDFNQVQIAFGYNGSDDYPQFLRTRHNASSTSGNAIDFFTSDGAQNGVFPTNAILGLSVTGGKVGVAKSNPAFELDVLGDINFTGSLLQNGSPFSAGGGSLWTDGGSVIYYDGNVGIGTGTPSVALDVVGDINFTGSLLQNGSPFSAGGGSLWTDGGSVIYYDGNVGIGTSSPSEALTVDGNLLLTAAGAGAATDIASLRVQRPDDVASEITMRRYGASAGATRLGVSEANSAMIFTNNGGAGEASLLAIGTVGNIPMIFGTNNAERMRILNSGNVGIGTTSPSFTLDVVGDINFSGQLLQGGSPLVFGNMNASTYDADSDNVVDNAEALATFVPGQTGSNYIPFVDGTGMMGIGTASPGATLDVVGGISLTGTLNGVSGAIFNNPSAGSGYTMIHTVTDAHDFRMGVGQSGETTHNVPGKWFLFDGTANTMRMVVDGTGNVGIGTPTPSTLLDVNGTVTASAFVGDGNALTNLLPANIATTGTISNAILPLGGSWTLSSALNLDANTLVVVPSVDRIGIGTASPLSRLHIKQASALAPGGLILESDNDTNFWAQYLNSNDTLLFSYNDSFEPFVIEASGQVGIYNTAPAAPLHVSYQVANGDVSVPAFIIENPATGSQASMQFRTNGTENARIRGDTFGNLTLSAEGGSIYFEVPAGTPRLTVEGTTGNVGVGNPAPLSTLDVAGSVARAFTAVPISVTTTLDDTHYFVLLDSTPSAFTLSLPPAASCPGREYVLKKVNSGASITVDVAGGGNIDASPTLSLSTQWTLYRVISDGTQWYVAGQ